ncbi:MAG TPA: hypothetical protein VLI45_06760, partial [Acidobacteriaceae bacterium]|nr:hypothetical protein [Acidobacteriaceae bacterium]
MSGAVTEAEPGTKSKQEKQVRRIGRELLRRGLTTIPVLWLVVTVVFLLIHLVPGDPIVQMLG